MALFKQNYYHHLQSHTSLLKESEMDSKTGGWNEEDQFRFTKVVLECGEGSSLNNLNTSSFKQKLKLLLPHIGHVEMNEHRIWYTAWKMFQQKRTDRLLMYERVFAQEKQKYERAFKHTVEEGLERDVRIQEKEEWDEKQNVLKEKLVLMRENKVG